MCLVWPADQALPILLRHGSRHLAGLGETLGEGLLGSQERVQATLRFFLTVCTLYFLHPGGVGDRGGLETDGHLRSLQVSQEGTLFSAHQGGCSAKSSPAAEPWAWEGESLPPGRTAQEHREGEAFPKLMGDGACFRLPIPLQVPSPCPLGLPPSHGPAFHPNLDVPPKLL